MRGAWIAAGLLLSSQVAEADQIRVAVASNFSSAVKALAAAFETQSEHEVKLVAGSTGKHFTQIKHGAPFEVFLAADADHPRRLENEALAVPDTRFTYAVGRLALWSPRDGLVDGEGQILKSADFRYLAIANPDLAPYGRAAEEVLASLGLWQDLQRRMVRGENIGQTFQFVVTGNAELGFVALSQVAAVATTISPGSLWRVPQDLYDPIEQQAVLLRDTDAARAFLAFVRSEEARSIIRDHGYQTP